MPKIVEQCVKKRLANADFQAPENSDKTREEFAYALCQTLYKKGKLDAMTVEIDGQEYWSFDQLHWYPSEKGAGMVGGGLVLSPVTDDVLAELNNLLGAEMDKNEILKFSGAFLARQEVNKNNDELNDENLAEIAATLPLKAIDYEHQEDKIVGLFIKGVVKGDGVATDGIIYARRHPQVALGIINGTHKLSIEANAKEAICSVCGGSFAKASEYCEHLVGRLKGSGAVRRFKGLVAEGGAVTANPAGTGTEIPGDSIVMIASQMEVEGGEIVVEKVIDLWSACDEDSYFGVEFTDMGGKQLSYQERSNLPDSAFALIQKDGDKKLRRFPIQDCAHARNALARLPNAQDLSSDERASIKRKAEAKLNSDECKTKSDTRGGAMDEFEKVKAELEKRIADLEGERDGLKTKLEATEKERDELKGKMELEVKAHQRELELMPHLSAEVLKEKRDIIAAMDDAAYELFKASLVGDEKLKAGILGSSRVVPGTGDGKDTGGESKRSWV